MVVFKYIEDLFKGEDAELIPEFDVCEGSPQIFNLMRLQCKFNIEYDDITGPVVNDINHKILCREAMKIAKSEQVDVFITPEYSIPYSIIDEIVEDNKELMRPERGKIWCLCCEGCTLDSLKNSLNKWEGLGIRIIRDAIDSVISNSFVDALIYIFRLGDNTLCFVPQLKTYPMADRDLNCEENGMCCGQIVFKIGKNKANKLLTIICADALNSRYICLNKIFEVGDENIILMHPQMNFKPRYDDFKDLRQNLYSKVEGDNLVYITANCAFETVLKNINTCHVDKIKNPWSCIYIKNRSSDWLNKQRELRNRNIKKGMRYGFLDKLKLDIWYSIKEENIQIIKVIKPRRCGAAVTTPNVDVLVNKLYQPSLDNNTWDTMVDEYKYDDDIENLIAVDCDNYKYPITADKEQRDKFFGLCFGDTELGELAIDKDEVCKLVSMHIDEECEEKRRDKLNNYPVLIECLNNAKLPKEFGTLVDNHIFTLKDDIFNLISNNDDERKIIVAYANNEKEAKRIEGIFRDLIGDRLNYVFKHRLLEEIKYLDPGSNRVNYCIFTMKDRTTQIITYPNFDKSITAKERVEDITSIKR